MTNYAFQKISNTKIPFFNNQWRKNAKFENLQQNNYVFTKPIAKKNAHFKKSAGKISAYLSSQFKQKSCI